MAIRIDSIENLTKDLAELFHISECKLLHEICEIDFNMGDDKGYAFIYENEHNPIREVYLCHLTRAFDNCPQDSFLPLNTLLVSQNGFSSFLEMRDVEFKKEGTKFILFYRREKIDWEKCESRLFNKARFRNRLTTDHCINGYQFLYDVKEAQQANYYLSAPEFLRDLDCLLGTNMVAEYRQSTRSYAVLCKASTEDIVFDSASCSHGFDEQYIYSALRYIKEYHFSSKPCGINPILRALDACILKAELRIPEERIPCHIKT